MTFIFLISGSHRSGFALPAKKKTMFSVNVYFVFNVLNIYVSVKMQ